MDSKSPKAGTTLSVHQAARLLAGDPAAVRGVEQELAVAIDRGELPANILRWATEQWEGERLEGNIDRMRTLIDRADLEAWCARGGRSLAGAASGHG